jgi:hypothetical protein
MVWVMTTRTGSWKGAAALRRSLRLLPDSLARVAWAVHRATHFVTDSRSGPRGATADHPDLLRLRTSGRRTGQERRAIPGYVEDGSDQLLIAMNGPADPSLRWLPDRHGYTLIAWR